MGAAGLRREVTRGQRVKTQALEATEWTEGAGVPVKRSVAPETAPGPCWSPQGRGLLSTSPTLLGPLGLTDQNHRRVGQDCGCGGEMCRHARCRKCECAGTFHEGLVRGHQAECPEDTWGDIWRCQQRLPPTKVTGRWGGSMGWGL